MAQVIRREQETLPFSVSPILSHRRYDDSFVAALNSWLEDTREQKIGEQIRAFYKQVPVYAEKDQPLSDFIHSTEFRTRFIPQIDLLKGAFIGFVEAHIKKVGYTASGDDKETKEPEYTCGNIRRTIDLFTSLDYASTELLRFALYGKQLLENMVLTLNSTTIHSDRQKFAILQNCFRDIAEGICAGGFESRLQRAQSQLSVGTLRGICFAWISDLVDSIAAKYADRTLIPLSLSTSYHVHVQNAYIETIGIKTFDNATATVKERLNPKVVRDFQNEVAAKITPQTMASHVLQLPVDYLQDYFLTRTALSESDRRAAYNRTLTSLGDLFKCIGINFVLGDNFDEDLNPKAAFKIIIPPQILEQLFKQRIFRWLPFRTERAEVTENTAIAELAKTTGVGSGDLLECCIYDNLPKVALLQSYLANCNIHHRDPRLTLPQALDIPYDHCVRLSHVYEDVTMDIAELHEHTGISCLELIKCHGSGQITKIRTLQQYLQNRQENKQPRLDLIEVLSFSQVDCDKLHLAYDYIAQGRYTIQQIRSSAVQEDTLLLLDSLGQLKETLKKQLEERAKKQLEEQLKKLLEEPARKQLEEKAKKQLEEQMNAIVLSSDNLDAAIAAIQKACPNLETQHGVTEAKITTLFEQLVKAANLTDSIYRQIARTCGINPRENNLVTIKAFAIKAIRYSIISSLQRNNEQHYTCEQLFNIHYGGINALRNQALVTRANQLQISNAQLLHGRPDIIVRIMASLAPAAEDKIRLRLLAMDSMHANRSAINLTTLPRNLLTATKIALPSTPTNLDAKGAAETYDIILQEVRKLVYAMRPTDYWRYAQYDFLTNTVHLDALPDDLNAIDIRECVTQGICNQIIRANAYWSLHSFGSLKELVADHLHTIDEQIAAAQKQAAAASDVAEHPKEEKAKTATVTSHSVLSLFASSPHPQPQCSSSASYTTVLRSIITTPLATHASQSQHEQLGVNTLQALTVEFKLLSRNPPQLRLTDSALMKCVADLQLDPFPENLTFEQPLQIKQMAEDIFAAIEHTPENTGLETSEIIDRFIQYLPVDSYPELGLAGGKLLLAKYTDDSTTKKALTLIARVREASSATIIRAGTDFELGRMCERKLSVEGDAEAIQFYTRCYATTTDLPTQQRVLQRLLALQCRPLIAATKEVNVALQRLRTSTSANREQHMKEFQSCLVKWETIKTRASLDGIINALKKSLQDKNAQVVFKAIKLLRLLQSDCLLNDVVHACFVAVRTICEEPVHGQFYAIGENICANGLNDLKSFESHRGEIVRFKDTKQFEKDINSFVGVSVAISRLQFAQERPELKAQRETIQQVIHQYDCMLKHILGTSSSAEEDALGTLEEQEALCKSPCKLAEDLVAQWYQEANVATNTATPQPAIPANTS